MGCAANLFSKYKNHMFYAIRIQYFSELFGVECAEHPNMLLK